ncbi:hypothetical protein [Pseudoxanthomonas sp. X-1]|uniref:hypothetical protein n=1 Tax=Pseudoxanthomonas sp. X-1 TaxID=2571115 RepID=UPI001486BF53|nr:hypothetical protein [Pseudoxanthomonas sp. X-1]UAY75999.1 hypothetical protein LAJ50_07115 [Pseudoxanthomonas sp. X-1]
MKTSNEYNALLMACKRIADGPQTYSEAKTADDWAEFYLEQAKGETNLNEKEPQ